MSNAYQFKMLSLKDLDQLLRIEQSTQPFPWTRSMMMDSLSAGYVSEGLLVDHQLIGYCFCSLMPPEADILTLCIEKTRQHQGYGKLLLQQVIHVLQGHGVRTIVLEVRRSNTAAIALYEKRGFKRIGIRENYYAAPENQREDALLFRLNIG